MEIKVGEYVRLKNGHIGKYIIRQHINYVETNNEYIGFNIEEDIVKHSPNIIDLIEVGDYVNGKEVFINAKEYLIFKDVGSTVYSESISPENIKSIVTKEQFEQIKYEV